MVEHKSDRLLLCKLCPKETINNIYIANCTGCKDVFCCTHLIEHRQQLSKDIEQLFQQHIDIKEKSITKLNINQQLECIDKWENETIEFIRQHTKDVKNKMLCIFITYKSQLQQYHSMLGKELDEKRDLKNRCIKLDLTELSQRLEQLDKEVQHVNKVLHRISLNELNQIVNKYKLSTQTLGRKFYFYKNFLFVFFE